MDYPNNRLIVNGVDLTTEYNLILSDGYKLESPTVKTYILDIPGGTGQLDLTETLLGDVAYNNRKQSFTFYVVNAQNFEQTKTQVSNFLHGKSLSYMMTMDPDYNYKGRFAISSYEHSMYSEGIVGIIVIDIDADPFKMASPRTYSFNAVGGVSRIFPSGRKRIRPTIQTASEIKVIYNNKLVRLPAGTWTLNDLFFEHGNNELYVNSFDVHNLTWKNLKTMGTTWNNFKNYRLFEWYNDGPTGETTIPYTWAELSDLAVNSVSYYQSTYNGTTPPNAYGESWSSAKPLNPRSPFLWTMKSVEHYDGSFTTSYTCEYFGTYQGEAAEILSSSTEYQIGNSGTSIPSGLWSDSAPTNIENGYLWKKTSITYSGNAVASSYEVVNTWNDLSVYTWADLVHLVSVPTDIENVTVNYEWGDL